MDSRKSASDPIYNTIESFLNHSDFDFATSVFTSTKKLTDDAELNNIQDNLEEFRSLIDDDNLRTKTKNKLQLIIYNKNLVKGDNLHGIVKIEVEKEIQEGHIELVLETTITINRPFKKKIQRFSKFVNFYKKRRKYWDSIMLGKKRSQKSDIFLKTNNLFWENKIKKENDSDEELILGEVKRVLYDKATQKARTVKKETRKSLRRLGTSITNEIKATKKKKILLRKKTNMSTFYKPFMNKRKRNVNSSVSNAGGSASMMSNKSVKSNKSNKSNKSKKSSRSNRSSKSSRSNRSNKSNILNGDKKNNQLKKKDKKDKKDSAANKRDSFKKRKRKSVKSEISFERSPANSSKEKKGLPKKAKSMKESSSTNLASEREKKNLKNADYHEIDDKLKRKYREEEDAFDQNEFFEYEDFMLGKFRRILFRLDQKIDRSTTLILPFMLSFPKNISVSHNHTLHSDDKINVEKLLKKRSMMLNLGSEFENFSKIFFENFHSSNSASAKTDGDDARIQNDRNIRSLINQKLSSQKLEGVKIEHRLSAYFIPKKSVSNPR